MIEKNKHQVTMDKTLYSSNNHKSSTLFTKSVLSGETVLSGSKSANYEFCSNNVSHFLNCVAGQVIIYCYCAAPTIFRNQSGVGSALSIRNSGFGDGAKKIADRTMNTCGRHSLSPMGPCRAKVEGML